jgi:hypothetical protein
VADWKSIKIREFEYVVTGPSMSLLRVSARAPRRRGTGARPTLLVQNGVEEHSFEPIQAPPDAHRVLRAAYSVPSELNKPGCRFWLVHEGGSRTKLPTPREGVARLMEPLDIPQEEPLDIPQEEPLDVPQEELQSVPQDPGSLAAPADDSELVVARERISALEREIADLQSAHERDLHAATEQAAEAQSAHERELRAATEQAAEAESAHQRDLRAAAERAAEAQSAHERDLLAAAERTAEAEGRATAAEGRAEASRDQAARAAATAERLEQRNSELEEALQARDARLASLEADLAEAQSARETSERELGKLRSAHARVERELDQARDQLRMMTFERDELNRQTAAFDAVAVKARERAAQAETANEKSTSALREIEIWRVELERRLTEATNQLAETKAAKAADEEELHRLRNALVEQEDEQRSAG